MADWELGSGLLRNHVQQPFPRDLKSREIFYSFLLSKKTRRNSAAPPTHREFFTQRISGFSDSRFLCCPLFEAEDVITPRKITLFKYKSWTEQQIRCRQKSRYFEDSCFSFRGRTQIKSRRCEQLRQSKFWRGGRGILFAFHGQILTLTTYSLNCS